MNTILFIENKEDILKLEALRKKTDFLIISLDPEVSYELEKKDIPFKIPDDYFEFNEYLNLGLENFEKVKKFCGYCDLFLQERINFLNENALNVTSYHYYCFKILFDVLSSKVFTLNKIFEKEKLCQVYFFDNEKPEKIDEMFFFNEKSPYNEVLKILQGQRGIDCKILKSGKNDGAQTPAAAEAKPVNILSKAYHTLKKIYFNLSGKYKNLPVIFMLSAIYDLSHIAGLIKKEKTARILCFDPVNEKEAHFIFPSWEKIKQINYSKTISLGIDFQKIWGELAKSKEFRDFFVMGGIDIFPAVEQRMEYFFTVFIRELVDLYLYCCELFKKYKPKIFLASYIIRAKMQITAQAAKKSGVPLAIYQHGGIYGYSECKINTEQEFQYSDYYISFGEGVKQRHLNCKSAIAPVGSFLLHNLSKTNTAKNKLKIKKKLSLNKNKKTVVYAANPVYRNWNYIDYIYYTDHEWFNAQKKIIDVFASHNDYEYVFKVFPRYYEKDPIIAYINDRKNKNFKIIYDIGFKELLPCADLIAMDAVSTPLLEALTTKQKIMVYDLYKGTYPDAVKVLKKRAYYSTDIGEYAAQLDKVLKEGEFEVKNPDGEFSDLYGKYENYDRMNASLHAFLGKFLKAADQPRVKQREMSMKIKLYTNYYDGLDMNPDTLPTPEEHAQGSRHKCGRIYNSKDAVIKHFLSENYYKLTPLSFLISFVYENKCRNIISLGAGVCVLEYLLKCALAKESIVCAADFDGFLIDTAKKFFPEIIPVEFNFAKDNIISLKNKLGINFDTVVFFHSAYALSDEEFISLFGDIRTSGVKYVVDFHGGCIGTKEVLEHLMRNYRNAVTGAIKSIKPVKALWEKINPQPAEKPVSGKFHGFGRTKVELRRLYKRAGFEIIRELTNYGYTAVLKSEQ